MSPRTGGARKSSSRKGGGGSGAWRKRFIILAVTAAVIVPLAYFVLPEILVGAAGLLISDDEPFDADAIVILAGGGPERSWEAADLYNAGHAPRVVLTTEQPPDGYREIERMGIDLVLQWENDLRVLEGLGVPAEAVDRIESISEETSDELTKIRQLAEAQGWSRLIIVTSNYHTRRSRVVAHAVFEGEWEIAVVGSRYSTFRPEAWWQRVTDARIFIVEFQKLLLYEVLFGPRAWF